MGIYSDITLNEIADLLKTANNIAVLCHENPDGDTLGSAKALYEALNGKYPEKTVFCVCADEVPETLRYVFDDGNGKPCLPENLPTEPDFVIALDIATEKLMGRSYEHFRDRIDVKIDHHESGSNFAKRYYVNSSASATAEIVWELCKLIGNISVPVANGAYTGIVTDTGCFRYSNTTSDTLRIAAEIKDAGAETVRINTEAFESRTKRELSAIRLALNNLRYYENGKIVAVFITNELKKEYGISGKDAYAISAFIKEIGEQTLAVTVRQSDNEPESYKISMRSKAPIDANALCALFGGGGHLRAAGASVKYDTPDKAITDIIKKVTEKINEQ